jgi:hypothetical protein
MSRSPSELSPVARLIARLAACGFAVELKNGGPFLVPTRREAFAPSALMADLRANRDAVLESLSTCRVCGRDVSDPEDRERMADPAHCDRGGATAATDGLGVYHEGCERCPYKPRD